MVRVIIAGSRNFYSPGIFNNVMTDVLSDIPNTQLEIVTGGCRGADRMGEQWAEDWDVKCTVFPADWNNMVKLLAQSAMNKWLNMQLKRIMEF